MARNIVNAWREILARIFADFVPEQNLSPEWLINPETRRPLKLDLLYSEIGLAIRFAGLRGVQQRAPLSLQEKAQQQARDSARTELTEAHGISLAILDTTQAEPKALFEALELAFSQAARRLRANGVLPPPEKSALLERLQAARIEARALGRQIKTERDLTPYLDLWQDRQFREFGASPATETPAANDLPALTPGLAIIHTYFGPGVVVAVSPNPATADDLLIQIRFEAAGERTFLASLLADKIEIV